jgi:hypothetical protein
MVIIEWETRAKERRAENKRLKKKIKELTISRDAWKVKAIERKESIDEMNQKLGHIKKNLQQIMGL